MYTSEDHQKHVVRARTTSYQRQIRLLYTRPIWLHVEYAGQAEQVPNKLIKATIIVDISFLGFNAHCMRPTLWQRAIHLPLVLATRCAFVVNSLRFSQSGLKLCFLFFYM